MSRFSNFLHWLTRVSFEISIHPSQNTVRWFFKLFYYNVIHAWAQHVIPTSWLNYLRRQIVFCLYVFSLYFGLFCIFYSLSLYLWTYQNFLWLYLCQLFILFKILHFITFLYFLLFVFVPLNLLTLFFVSLSPFHYLQKIYTL